MREGLFFSNFDDDQQAGRHSVLKLHNARYICFCSSVSGKLTETRPCSAGDARTTILRAKALRPPASGSRPHSRLNWAIKRNELIGILDTVDRTEAASESHVIPFSLRVANGLRHTKASYAAAPAPDGFSAAAAPVRRLPGSGYYSWVNYEPRTECDGIAPPASNCPSSGLQGFPGDIPR